eukprot:851591-Pelagomonas_calceolata.AAC.1
MARLVEGMSSVDSPTHNQEDWVHSNLCTLELFAQFAVLLLGYGGLALSYFPYCAVPSVGVEWV